MNKSFRSAFNASLGAWVAVPETSLARGKPNRAGRRTALKFALAAAANPKSRRRHTRVLHEVLAPGPHQHASDHPAAARFGDR